MKYLIDPKNITNYNLSHAELEVHILFWVFAAGHNAISTARGIDKFLTACREKADLPTGRPFVILNYLKQSVWLDILRKSGLGCWRRKSRTIKELVESFLYDGLDLKTCSVAQLENIYGIGPKTARCLILHSRRDINNLACLDTHVLKYMRDNGIKVPTSTPTGKKYLELEKEFLKLARASDKTLAEFDLDIWNAYSTKRT